MKKLVPHACLFVRYALAMALLGCLAAPAMATTEILAPETIEAVQGYNDAADTVEPVDVEDKTVPFTRALRVSRATPASYSYAATLIWPTVAPVRKGDLIVATFYVRKLTPTQGSLAIEMTLQQNDEPYTSTLDYPAGEASFQIRYALQAQSFEVGGVSVINHGTVADPLPPEIVETFAYYYPGRGDPDAPWRQAAEARIADIRQGSMVLRVVDTSGNPVKDAEITLAQSNSLFVWSTAVSALSLVCSAGEPEDTQRDCPDEDVLNTTVLTIQDYARLRTELRANFTGASFYNDLKWTDWHFDRELALEGLAWFERNKIAYTRGHNLIWPSFDPDFLMPNDIINRATPTDEVARLVDERMREQVNALKGKIPEWDVLNEPFTNYDIQGRIATSGLEAIEGVLPASSVARWFQLARAADPDAKLFLNDFGILERLNPVQQQYDLALLQYVQHLGGPVDGMGFQGHFGASGPQFADMQRVIDDFAPHVETMSLTEFDFTTLDPTLQADVTRDVMTFIFSQPEFNLFQMWGFWDGDHWLGNAPLFSRDWTLKPSGAVWRDLTQNTWRTNISGTSDGDGVFAADAFYGTYDISVSAAGKTCTSSASFTSSGQTLTIVADC
jgi:endo-1,4-beta-xylanase